MSESLLGALVDFRHDIRMTDETKREVHRKYSLWDGHVKSETQGRLLHRFECRKCHRGVWLSFEKSNDARVWDTDYVKDAEDGVRYASLWLSDGRCNVGEIVRPEAFL